MGLFNLGFITTYMSDPMIGGFTTGAAVHVGTSQVKYLFGLKIPRSDGVCQIIRVRVIQYIYIYILPLFTDAYNVSSQNIFRRSSLNSQDE